MQSDMFSAPAGAFIAYCDGACKGNGQESGPSNGGWGVLLTKADGTEVSESYGGALGTTNNQMELMAAIKSLEAVAEGSTITVFTDSQYVQKGLTEWLPGWLRRNWKTAGGDPVKNVALWKELLALRQKRKVTLEWVRGHNGHPGNERADKLANMGAAQALLDASAS